MLREKNAASAEGEAPGTNPRWINPATLPRRPDPKRAYEFLSANPAGQWVREFAPDGH
jgi:hypothetical protein